LKYIDLYIGKPQDAIMWIPGATTASILKNATLEYYEVSKIASNNFGLSSNANIFNRNAVNSGVRIHMQTDNTTVKSGEYADCKAKVTYLIYI
jgi:hypothetical protein